MQSFIRLLAAGAVAALPTAASAVVVDFEEVVFPTSDLFIPFQTQPYTENGFTFTVLSNHYDFIGGGDTAIQLDSLALDSSNFNALTSIEITSAGGAFSLASMFVATSFRENTGTTDFTELLDPGIFRIEADVTGGGSETGNFTASLNTLETFDDAFNDITALRLVQNVPGQLRISEFTFGDPVTSGGMDGGGDTPGGGMTGGGMNGWWRNGWRRHGRYRRWRRNGWWHGRRHEGYRRSSAAPGERSFPDRGPWRAQPGAGPQALIAGLFPGRRWLPGSFAPSGLRWMSERLAFSRFWVALARLQAP